jgi:phosphoglycerol transferase
MTEFLLKLRASPLSGPIACALTVGAAVWMTYLVMEVDAVGLCVAGLGIFLALFALDRNNVKSSREAPKQLLRLYWSFIPAFVLGVWVYLMDAFGYFDWGSFLLHADEGAMAPDIALEYLQRTGTTVGVIVVFLFGLAVLKARGTLTGIRDAALSVILIAVNPMISDPVKAAMLPNPLGDFLAKRFIPVDPNVRLAAAANDLPSGPPKNILHIFIESAERTYLVNPEFDGVMDPLKEFDQRGLSAHDMVQIKYTYNSIAGIVAANCGIPLFMTSFTTKRFFEENDSFLPGATCLGDILKKRGYDQAFVSGWPMEFTGQGTFFSTHGYSSLAGGPEVLAAVPGAGAPFGADDGQVLDYSARVLRKLNEGGKPFSLAIAVSGGHAIDGYVTKRCEGKIGVSASEPNILHAVKCTNMLIADFIHKAEAEGLLDNTIIVLQSDHLTQPSTVTKRLDKYQRRNFFSISGPGIKRSTHKRPSSTTDIFPTILEALDAPLTQSRAALSTSLFSDELSLVEELGEEFLNKAIMSEEVLSRSLWQAPSAEMVDELALRQ